MTRIDEFDAFYHESRRQLLHLTYAVSGDIDAAAAGLQDAYAHAWQRWAKVRSRDPLGYVRTEASRTAALRHGTHLLRRHHAGSDDVALLKALSSLSSTQRHLITLQTIGDLDLVSASRECSLPVVDGERATEQAVAALEKALDLPIGAVERRLAALRETTDQVPLARASILRRQGRKRSRRRSVLGVVAATAAVIASGVFVTTTVGSEQTARPFSTPPTGQPVKERGAGETQLLRAEQVDGLDRTATWVETSTTTNLALEDTYATCQESRFADPGLKAAYLRTFKTYGEQRQVLLEAVEVSRTARAAMAARRQMVQWYAGCQLPRVQLVDTYTIERDDADVIVMELRKWSEPVRTLTVAITRSGVVTSAVIHEVDRPNGPSIRAFSRTVAASLRMQCRTSGGECDGNLPGARPAPPPPTGEPRGFLGVVDLPPIANLQKVWVGTDPTGARPNPAATLCDRAEFTVQGMESARSRVFVIPEATGLPLRFGISQVRGTFRVSARAEAFVEGIRDRIASCADDNLSATVTPMGTIRAPGVVGQTWRMTFEVNDTMTTYYRVGIVRNGAAVSQVTFSPSERYDVTARAFDELVERAGQRLAELG